LKGLMIASIFFMCLRHPARGNDGAAAQTTRAHH